MLEAGGAMLARMSSHDWSSTPLGPRERWPEPLRTLVQTMLGSKQPMCLAWGADSIMLFNDACGAILGEGYPSALGRPFVDVWRDVGVDIAPALHRALSGDASGMDDNPLVIRREGRPSATHFALSCTPVSGSRGEILGALCLLQETTAHISTQHALQETEDALRESDARFREMANGLPLIVWMHDGEGNQELVNDTFCRFFGVTREEMRGDRWQVLMHPDDAEAYSTKFFTCARDRIPFHAEVRVKRADGQWRWIESWAHPRFTEAGTFRGFVGTSADITERKEAEAAIREGEERFRTLADNIAQLAWMADGEGWTFWYNKRWLEYAGTTLEEMRGWGWRRVHHPDHVDRVVDKIKTCFETGETWEDTFPLRGKDGTYRWFLSRALPIRDEAGNVVRWFGTNTDVTEQREAEERLRESDRRKDEFLAMLGHELRNPLAAIGNATELLKLTETHNPELRQAYDVLERQTRHMARLIDGLLEVSRVALGKIDLQASILDVRQILRGVLQDRTRQIASRGLHLEAHLPSEPLWISGDAVRLSQVFSNLVGNAIKFTDPPGTLHVSARRHGGDVVVEVEDTGIGIGPAALERIFEPFQQEAQDMARAGGGLGLGLAVARALIELHGGTIAAESDGRGAGTKMTARLPLTGAPSGNRSADEASEVLSRRVLVVEDNRDAAYMLRAVLKKRGHDVEIVHTGADALELLRSEKTNVVLCDIGLPGMNGYDLARAIRADDSLAGIRLVAMTGYGQPEDRMRTMDAGFDEHLTKPVDVAAIESVFRRLSAP